MKKYSIYILFLSRFLRSVSGGLITIGFPYLILKDLHIGSFKLGIIYTLATFSTALISLIFGILGDIYNRKLFLIILSFFLPISSFFLFLKPTIYVAFFSAIIGGYSATGSLASGGVGGAIMPLMNAIMGDILEKENKVFYFSLMTFITGIGGAVGALIGRFFSIKDIFLFASITSFLASFILIFIDVNNERGSFKELKSKLTIGKFSFVGFLNGLSQGLINPFLIPFFIITYDISKNIMSVYSFIGGLLGSFSPMLATFLNKRFGFVKSITITRGLGAFLVLIFPFVKIFYLSVLIYILLPSLRVIALPIQQSKMVEKTDSKETARAFSLNQVSRLSASSIGTFLASEFFLIDAIFMPFLLYSIIVFVNIGFYKKFFEND